MVTILVCVCVCVCVCDVWIGSVPWGKVYLCSVVGDRECLGRLGHGDCGAAQ
jgi:hypothetical protein